MSEHPQKLSKKIVKNQEPKKMTTSPRDHPPRKQQRKAENPVRIPPPTEQCVNFKCPKSWICKNSACQASISMDDKFCKRCSCCICHSFDDNKDPSLWLECISESGEGESCGLTCHVECAFKQGKVGVVDLGQLMQLDGSYCCVSCGKVSEILGYWKKQLCIAKDARRVDILCFRIYMSYRLLDGTSRFKELHNIIKEAKAKLEAEVGPVNGSSTVMARGIVSRLSVAGAVQSLCSLAIKKADEWLAKKYSAVPNYKESSLLAACKIHFEEATPSSVVVVLVDILSASSVDVKGYKIWYRRAEVDTYPKEPNCVLPKSQRRILISNLQSCMEYCFRVVSYTESGDLGHAEAKCFTKSDLSSVTGNQSKENLDSGGSSGAKTDDGATIVESDSGFKVRDLGKITRMNWEQQEGSVEALCGADTEKCLEVCNFPKPNAVQEDHNPSASCQLDLNVALIPDLNEELTPESSRDEHNGCVQIVDVEDAVSNDNEGNCVAGSHGSGDSQNWNHLQTRDVTAVDSELAGSRKRAASTNGDTQDSDSALLSGSPNRARNSSGLLDENFEHCVKTIRWLECEGHINNDFRLKFLSWFSLRSTERERRVVNTYIQTLIDDPSSLAGQLVHSFLEIISTKRPHTGFCGRLWH
ncbi:VIN3-like protein 1 [Ipomoea triloba]|uniref:VIN3-like protein 1 n=1 Tax=Ipomoea triloba TaxID=35885 RepID=UPI00125CED4F|nr:VIN3-like protein 1 [Ipomoea triloba]XP_031096196.1 VIN3-like protein 1 [Ipomoea triloba]XP_031096197.1 VIN3-like protein 1 [Ipomoea triloba]XP_031096198.1 VIN3-like protein 1 [Ipomoea triloba]XP_031096199.1 VIN3-like protein 1 [Ipomoea triloba]